MRVPIIRGLMIATVALAVSNGVAFAGPYEDAQAAIDRGDYATSLQLMKPLAEQGEATAQNNLGWMYQYGLGVRQDYDEAVRLYRLAVAQGNVLAQVNLGVIYFDGFGVPKDYHEAVRLYRLAVAQGSSADAAVARTAARAAANLGLMYENGLGVPQDYVLSYMWLTVFKTNSATALLQTIVSKMRPEQCAWPKNGEAM
jgi:TPR repeat protein